MIIEYVAAFAAAAALLTITPGLDTALVLRTAASEGPYRAALAGAGIVAGILVWGFLIAVGLAVLIVASAVGFTILKWAGAAYLVYLGVRLVLGAGDRKDSLAGTTDGSAKPTYLGSWFTRGLMTNLLNPKIGVFYISFLPQFIPAGVNSGVFSFMLATLHAALTLIWFALLIAATKPIVRLLRKPGVLKWLDRFVGAVFVSFGVRLALSARG
jgi:threonine/homoserine/homoserine lactone efflux protein